MPRARTTIFRHSPRDAWLVAGAIGHATVLLLVPPFWVIGLGLWWNANTVAHNFIHLPFFTRRAANVAFAAFLSLLMGAPHRLWRDRHRAHHAGRPWKFAWSPQLAFELSLLAALWAGLAITAPGFFFRAYVPGWALGLFLCHLQGRYEHCRGTVSHYGRAYNTLFFNDGYHVEHHRKPWQHWSQLCQRRDNAASSAWPAVLRWAEQFSTAGKQQPTVVAAPNDYQRATQLACVILDQLERIVIRAPSLRRWVLQKHARAMGKLLQNLPQPKRIGVVGGGLYPRTALILRNLYPEAEIIALDLNHDHVERAREQASDRIQFRIERFTGATTDAFDLISIPLAYQGNRQAIYMRPPAPVVVVHDWIWNWHWTRPEAVVSFVLLKRINLVMNCGAASLKPENPERPIPPERSHDENGHTELPNLRNLPSRPNAKRRASPNPNAS
jgi:hypothetical protein